MQEAYDFLSNIYSDYGVSEQNRKYSSMEPRQEVYSCISEGAKLRLFARYQCNQRKQQAYLCTNREKTLSNNPTCA